MCHEGSCKKNLFLSGPITHKDGGGDGEGRTTKEKELFEALKKSSEKGLPLSLEKYFFAASLKYINK